MELTVLLVFNEIRAKGAQCSSGPGHILDKWDLLLACSTRSILSTRTLSGDQPPQAPRKADHGTGFSSTNRYGLSSFLIYHETAFPKDMNERFTRPPNKQF